MKTLHFRKWSYDIPESWNEMDGKRMLQVMKAFTSEMGDEKGILTLFRALADIPWYQFYLMREPSLMDTAIECTEFLFGENTLTRNHLPYYGGLYGPADGLCNMKMAEFCFSEHRYVQYKQNPTEENLNMFIAVIYREGRNMFYDYVRNPDGDVRQKFNDSITPHLALRISKWPHHVKRAIVFFYEGARDAKIKANDKVFGSSNGEESLHGLWSVMRSVAKEGAFGDFDRVNEQYVDTILMDLNEVVAEAERIEMEQNRVTVNQ